MWPNTWLEPPSLVSMSTWLGSCTCGAALEEQDAQARPIAAAHRSYVAFANFAGPTGGGYKATAWTWPEVVPSVGPGYEPRVTRHSDAYDGFVLAPRGRTTTLHALPRTSVRLTLPSSTVRIGP